MKILIVQLGRIGDTVLTTPLFKVLKEKIENLELHVLSGRNNYHFLLEHPFIDKVFIYDKKIVSSLRMISSIRKTTYDFWIDIKDHPSTESALLAKLGKAKTKIGFNGEKHIFDIDPHSEYNSKYEHYVEVSLRPVKYLNIHLKDRRIRPNLFENDKSKQKLTQFLRMNNIDNYYCLNNSATADSRMLQKEKWHMLLDQINQEGKKCLIISDPKAAVSTKELASKYKNIFYYPTTSIVDVFSVIKNSELVITVDTSIVHIASAFNKTQLCFYTNLPNKIIEFSPLSDKYRLVKSPNEGDSVTDIKIEDVLINYNQLTAEING